MLKVDLYKQIIFEGLGVDMSRLPSRCRTVESVGDYVDFRFYHLSEWVLVEDERVISDTSYNSVADANYYQKQLGGVVRRVVDCLELLEK